MTARARTIALTELGQRQTDLIRAGVESAPPARVKRVCSVDRCDRDAHCRGWCDTHYTRWRRHGDVMADEPIGPKYPGTRRWSTVERAKPGDFDLEDTGEL